MRIPFKALLSVSSLSLFMLPCLAQAQSYGVQGSYGVQRGPSYDYVGSNSARAYQGTVNPLTSRVNPAPEQNMDDTSITEQSTCKNAVDTLEAAYRQGGAGYGVLSKMALDSVVSYIPEDRNGNPLPGVNRYLFNKLIGYCKANPGKTLGNGAEYAKDSLDALIISALPK